MKNVILFGASGSIGGDTLSIMRDYPADFSLVGLGLHRDCAGLRAMVEEFSPGALLIADPGSREAWLEANPDLAGLLLPVEAGPGDLLASGADIVLNGVMGFAGLAITLAALELDMDVALANKESLVCGGDLLMEERARSGGRLLPVDSEHSALWQLLAGHPAEQVSRVWLTASGGPFREWSATEMATATPEQALAHPTWSMGPKISIDSATLINKGLEVIEAALLFDLSADIIDVLVHPGSHAHALIELRDSSLLCQLAAPDMRQPILHALAHPRCLESEYGRLDPAKGLTLRFDALDGQRFPAVDLAREALRRGGSAALALNAADEVAVEAFLAGKIDFPGIVEAVQAVLLAADWERGRSFEDLLRLDARARELTTAWLHDRAGSHRVGTRPAGGERPAKDRQ